MISEVKIPRTKNELVNGIRNSNIEKFEVVDDIQKSELSSLIKKVNNLMINGRSVSVVILRSKK
tara:strand:+ start:557 stop:748 length:192 start_codon:yes stop_codon:yes gene_type:complete